MMRELIKSYIKNGNIEATLWYENGIADHLEVKMNGRIVGSVDIDENGYTEHGEHYMDMYIKLSN